MSFLTYFMTINKQGLTVSTYMSRLKCILDDLALTGHPIGDLRIVTYILNGLQDLFKQLTNVSHLCDALLFIEDLFKKI